MLDNQNFDQQFENREDYIFMCGFIMAKVMRALFTEHENPKIEWVLKLAELHSLKEFLIRLSTLDPEELVNVDIEGMRPFKNIQPQNIVRFPDQPWADSMVDNSTDDCNPECPCEIAISRNKIWLRWTLPEPEYIENCFSVEKIIYTAMVVVEELLHLGQKPNLNSYRMLSLESDLEIYDRRAMTKEDSHNIQVIRESDVTAFMKRIVSKQFQNLQWFRDREKASGDDIHKILSISEVVELAIQISENCGYPEELLEELIREIHYHQLKGSNFLNEVLTNPKFIQSTAKYLS